MGLELLLVNCVVRLEDTHNVVATTAGRCLQQLVGTLCTTGPLSSAADAGELLQRREDEQMSFEQFVFPFVALVHRSGQPGLAARRLEICRTYFVDGPREHTDSSAGSAVCLPTCVAAGFVAAAFARCLAGGHCTDANKGAAPRPSALLCSVCKDLMELMAIEDSEF